ncbi:MAG TPA: response regulator transcription factor [Flavisolibacter sp.]|nr:response regulator transcription factor [Flavisolibacter sp.]
MRFIIADDHRIVRRGIKEIIQDEFPTAIIEEASDSESLINKILNQNFDLVITDISMPGRNGLEALQQIRQLRPSLPVIVLTIHPESQYAIRAYKNGAKGYLNKETAPDELVSAIKHVLAGKKYITQSVAEDFFATIEKKEAPLHQHLSNREFEVLKLIASGKSNSEIAKQLLLSETTVSTYRTRILEKLNLQSTAEIIRYAIHENLI